MMYSFDFSLLPGVEKEEAATGDSWTKIGTCAMPSDTATLDWVSLDRENR